MNTHLDKKIKELLESIDSFSKLEIRLECPLNSGIKVTISGVKNNEVFFPKIPNGIKAFFQFVNEAKQQREKFNVVLIDINADRTYKTTFLYDEELQKTADENVK